MEKPISYLIEIPNRNITKKVSTNRNIREITTFLMAANPNLIKPTSVIELVSKTPIYNGIIKPDDIPFDQKLNYHILLNGRFKEYPFEKGLVYNPYLTFIFITLNYNRKGFISLFMRAALRETSVFTPYLNSILL